MTFEAVDRDWSGEAAHDLAERRWFALISAVQAMQAECAVLLEAAQLADSAWRRACAQLAEFETLRDALEEQTKPPQPLKFGAKREFPGARTHWTAATSARSAETAGP